MEEVATKDGSKKMSKVRIRMRIQDILYKNTKPVLGRFDTKELNERLFLNDLFKEFDLTPQKI